MSLYDETTSVLINPEQLRVAISAIEEGVNRSKKTINLDAKAHLIIIAYNILGERKSDNAAENVADKSHTIIQISIDNDIITFNISDKNNLKLKKSRRIRNVKTVL